jgi:hypothetical protein
MEIPKWDPLIIYLDMDGYNATRHQSIRWLKKSLSAFLDWFVARRTDIDSICIIPYEIISGKFVVKTTFDPDEASPFSESANTFIETIIWATKHDPTYQTNWNRKIGLADIERLMGMNFQHQNLRVFMNVLSPDIILTGRASNEWASRSPTQLINRLGKEFILFDGYGTTEGLDALKKWHDRV